MGVHVSPILNTHPIPQGHPSAPALSTLSQASNLDWRFISYMILYMFQCHSPKPSHPRPLPQSPKDCSIHLCLFCCVAYRVIVTIFRPMLGPFSHFLFSVYPAVLHGLSLPTKKPRSRAGMSQKFARSYKSIW